MREGFLYRCGECDQIFMLVRVTYGNSWVDESYKDHKEIFAKDPDVDDVFDIKLLERGFRSSGFFNRSTLSFVFVDHFPKI